MRREIEGMFCRMGLDLNKRFQQGLAAVGAISLVIGLFLCFTMNDAAGYSMGLFSGMMTGIGAASLVLGIGHLYKISRMSEEMRQKLQNQADDERVRAINAEASRRTVMIVGIAALVISLASALLGNVTVTFTLVGTIYAILICFMVIAHLLEKKM